MFATGQPMGIAAFAQKLPVFHLPQNVVECGAMTEAGFGRRPFFTT
jgi:hypothetical protein